MKNRKLKQFILIFSLLFTNLSFSQSVLINPQVEGGFELSGGFNGNGWSVVNSAVNKWNLSALPVPFQGSRAAFISPNLGNDYVYDILSVSTSHIYRDITVPAGENFINLNFWYKNPGEPLFDRLLVYIAPVTVNPTADIPSNGLVDFPGATLVYTDAANIYSYTNVDLLLPQSLAGSTFRLIFTWQNDSSDGTAIPVALDNVSLTSQSSQFGTPLNGYYSIDNTAPTSPFLPNAGSNFANFQDAINYLNNYGISGDVRFDVKAGQIFNHSPLIINVGGNSSDTIAFVKSGNGVNPQIRSTGGTGASGGDGAITINGADYITFDGIDIFTDQNPSNSVLNIESGFKIINSTATNGAQNNRIANCSIYMFKSASYTSNIGISVSLSVAPSAIAGTNSFNQFYNVSIENSVFGIRVISNATYRDDQIKIEKCVIGSETPNSIGGIAGQVQGIIISNAQNVIVKSNIVRNVSTNANIDGIFLSSIAGLSSISGNKVFAIRNTSASSSGVATGIRCVVASSSTVNIFNNFVSDISTAYNTASVTNPAVILVKGISIQPTGVVSSSAINVDFNNVSINTSLSPNISSACLEVIQTGPIVRLRNNILANFTSNQSGFPFHYGLVVPNFNITTVGGVSNYNDIFIPNSSNGVLVRKTASTATNYTTLSSWKTATSQDLNSLSVDPFFNNPNSDLHVFATDLDQTGSMTGITWITDDIDQDLRLTPPDIGADEFSLIPYDISVEKLIFPDSLACFTDNEQFILKIRNKAYQSVDFTITPLSATIKVSGALTNQYNITVNDNSLNGGLPLISSAYLEIPIDLIDISSYGTYNFTAFIFFNQDLIPENDTLSEAYSLTHNEPFTIPQNVSFDGFNSINLKQIFQGWEESQTSYPIDGFSYWSASSGLDNPSNISAIYNMNIGYSNSFIIGPKIRPEFNTFISFDLALTDAFSIAGVGQFDLDDSLQLLVSSDCGITFQTIAFFNQDSIMSNTLKKYYVYLGAYQGQEIICAFKASDGTFNGLAFGIHLDNIHIYNSIEKSVFIESIALPNNSLCFSNAETFSITMGNNGFSNIDFTETPVSISSYLNDEFVSMQILASGFLAIDDLVSIPINSSIDLTLAGKYKLKVIIELTSQSGTISDSSVRFIISQNPSVSISGPDSLCINQVGVFTANPVVYGHKNQLLPRFKYIGSSITIPDNTTNGINIPIEISGSGGFASQLVEVRIDSVLHNNITQLSFKLIAPNGSSIVLTQFNQGNGPGFFSTAFRSDASNVISQSAGPFSGVFIPQESFDNLTGDANGTWFLSVSDYAAGTIGQFISWSLILYEQNNISSFNWQTSNIIVSETVNNLSVQSGISESISYELTDINGCSVIGNKDLFVSNPSLSVNNTNISCFGESNGSVSVIADGGIAPYAYSWSNGSTNQTQGNLSAGTYSVFVTDKLACSASSLTTLSEPLAINITSSSTNSSCGNSDGTATVSASGGTGSYSYLWSTGATSSSVSGLGSGVYTVRVRDNSACWQDKLIIINDVDAPILATSATNVTCNGGSDGTLSAVVSGGELPFSYLWSNGSSSMNQTGISAGTYTLTVRDNNNCSSSSIAVVFEPIGIIAKTISSNSTCGNTNGSASVVAIGGTGSYSYLWSTGATTSTITNLGSGIYNVTITDGSFCTATSIASVSDQDAPILTTAVVDVTCNGGSDGTASVTASGGALPLSYTWSTGSTAQTLIGLAPGVYAITVMDALACKATEIVTVSAPSAINASLFSTNSSCGNNDGTAIVSASGGTGSYSYLWSTGANTSSISDLSAGTYTVQLTDATSCSIIKSLVISDIEAPNVTLTSTNVSCNGSLDGSISSSVFGGAGNYQYLWSTNVTTPGLSGIGAGTYSLILTDALGCISTASVTLTEPPAINITTSSTNSSCGNSDGTATISASGGTGSYSYLWSTGATSSSVSGLGSGVYTVRVRDNSACWQDKLIIINDVDAPILATSATNVTCNGGSDGTLSAVVSGGELPFSYLWSNGSSSMNQTGISAGTYTLTVRDNNNCSSSSIAVVFEPIGIIAKTISSNSTCGNTNGSASVVAIGGTGSYSYLWSTGATTSTITNLGSGIYNVTITDGSFCTATSIASVSDQDAPILTTAVVDVTCNGGSDGTASVTASGGALPLSYTWSTGSTAQTLIGLAPGVYAITVMDALACKATEIVTVSAPSAINASLFSTNSSCGNNDGTAIVSASGGTGSYSYLWSTGANTSSISDLSAGTYTVQITDAAGCFVTESIQIADFGAPPTPVILSNDEDNKICEGQLITLFSSSPSMNVWSTGETSSTISVNSSVLITLKLINDAGCQSNTTSIEITVNQLPVVDAGADTTICREALAILKGSGAVYYLWDNGIIDGEPFNPIPNTTITYTLTGTDSNGCQATDQVSITEINCTFENYLFTVYPNPTDASVIIYSNDKIGDSFELFDNVGKLLFSDKIYGSTLVIDLSQFQNGVYNLRLFKGSFELKPSIKIFKY